jgi:hypothetical protein
LKDLRKKLRTAPNQLEGPEVGGSPSDGSPTAFTSNDGSGESDAQSAAQLSVIMNLAVPKMTLGDIDISPEEFLQSIDL